MDMDSLCTAGYEWLYSDLMNCFTSDQKELSQLNRIEWSNDHGFNPPQYLYLVQNPRVCLTEWLAVLELCFPLKVKY